MKVDDIKRFVLDASVTLAWCFPEEATHGTEDILDLLTTGVSALTPSIWPFEVANALLVGERRKRLTIAQVTVMLHRISTLPIFLDPARSDHIFDRVLSLARQEQLTEYDASYLELALRERLPLATLDDRLRRAAKSTGVSVLKV